MAFVALLAVGTDADECATDGTTITMECGYTLHGTGSWESLGRPDTDTRTYTRTVDPSRCFVGDLCCCQYDAFDMAFMLLAERETKAGETVLLGRIEDVRGLPDSPFVRRDARATVAVEKVFRSRANAPEPRIGVRVSSDMFLWPETGRSRIATRRAIRREHREGDRPGNAPDVDWEGEIRLIPNGSLFPDAQCGHSGAFAEDRGGALEVGGTYLLALAAASGEAGVDYVLYDDDWTVFAGDEMDEVVHALDYTVGCLRWPVIASAPEDELIAALDICFHAARGMTWPHEIKRHRANHAYDR